MLTFRMKGGTINNYIGSKSINFNCSWKIQNDHANLIANIGLIARTLLLAMNKMIAKDDSKPLSEL